MSGEAVRGSLVDGRRESRGGSDGAGPILMDLQNAARALSISARALWEWTRAGKVPHVRLGKRILFEPDALRAWARSHRCGPDTRFNRGRSPISANTGRKRQCFGVSFRK